MRYQTQKNFTLWKIRQLFPADKRFYPKTPDNMNPHKWISGKKKRVREYIIDLRNRFPNASVNNKKKNNQPTNHPPREM